jgi:hypothetical protein
VLAARPAVASVPLNCAAVPGAPDGCQVGGSGVADGLGKVRVYHTVRLGPPRPGGCREAAVAGSLNGGAWSASGTPSPPPAPGLVSVLFCDARAHR